jgi:putative acetyltransferase
VSDFVVRPARASDLPPLIDVLQRVVAENRYLSPELPIDCKERLTRWQDLLADDDSAMFVACDCDVPVGEVALTMHPEYGMLLGMLLDAPYRGRGAGSALLQTAIGWAASRGHAQLSLLVFAHNESAIGLYRKFGFAQLEYYKADVIRSNGEQWDTILMRRELSKHE